MAGMRKTPLRKCVITNEMRPKRELIRVVRTPDGDVQIDPTSKQSGRGAYISADPEVIQEAKKKNILSRHLKTNVDAELYDLLLAEAEGLKK
ncbi:YlxR family protein [Evansella sp. LMS18]|uniref:RNase P modulator RnpM n=1 Tax=Evansella sp. LMS18 TaxID=2924033 RepID=UPI0020D11623|nr:YlxR family protein [Evansella sp. LMS18]UTR10829.1 YlxR family protein [Evansella sp. LMS18]